MTTEDPVFKRVLIKLSGEALMGPLDYGTDPATVEAIAMQLKAVHDRGVEIAVVLGAGNIYRGLSEAAAGMDRATADYMGMLAIVLNALTLQDALEKVGVHTRVQSAITVSEVAEPYIRRRAMRPAHQPRRRVHPRDLGPRGALARPEGDGLHRAVAVHGQSPAHPRVQHG